MTKVLTRIGIIALVAYGGWYLWSAKSNPQDSAKNSQVEMTTENPAKKSEKDENLTFEIKKGSSEKTLTKEEKEKLVKPLAEPQKTTKSAKRSFVKKPVAEKVEEAVVVEPTSMASGIQKFAGNSDNTPLTVYFYDYKIDLSSKEIPAGDVVIRAVNNGRLSHDLTIKDGNGQVDFGRVAPKVTKYFKVNLRAGEFQVLSQVPVDQDHDMIEFLSVR